MRRFVLLISFLLFTIVLIRPAYSLKGIFRVTNPGNDLMDYQLRINLPEELANKSLAVYDEEGNYLNFCYDYESGECLKDLITIKAYYSQGTSCLSASNNINFPSTPNEFHNWRKDNWPGCDNCDFYVRIKIWNITPINSLKIRINSDDGHWVWINGIYKGHGGGGCHGSATSDKWYDLSSSVQAGYNEIWVWCSEAAGGERCQISLEVNGKRFQDWLIPSNSIWIKSDFSANSNKTIYVEESSNNATSGENVFIFYDDFSTSANWNLYNCQIGYGVLDCNQGGSDYSAEKVKQIPMWNIILESRMWTNDNDGPNAGWDIGINCNGGGDSDGSCSGNMYLIALEANHYYKIYEHSGTSWSNIRSKSYSLPANQWLKVKIVMKDGGNITTFVNGNLIDSFVDSTPRSDDGGYLAIREWEGGVENVRIRKFAEPKPQVSFLGIVENRPPSIEIYSPENRTYYSNNISLIFRAYDDNSTILHVKAFLDEQLIYENDSFVNDSIVSLNLAQFLSSKSHLVKIWVNDTSDWYPRTSEAQVSFYIWYGLNLSVFNANGTKFSNALIAFSNSTHSLGKGFYSKSNFFSKKICPSSGWQSTYEINLNKKVTGNTTFQIYLYEHVYSGDCLSFTVYFEGYRNGNWETIKSIGYGYCGGYPTGHYTYQADMYSSQKVYEKFRFRYRVTNYDADCSSHGCGSCYYNVKIEWFNLSYRREWNLPLMLEWSELPQGKINITAEHFGFDNETKEVEINNSMGLVNLNLTLYRLQRFRAKDKRSGAWLSNFTITFFKNSVPYLNKTVENELVVSLRDLQLGNNLIRVRKFGYNDTFETLYFDLSSEYDKIFYLWRSGLILNVFDEISGEKLKFNAQIFNSTYSLSFENVEKIDKQWYELPQGFVTIRIWNESYVEGSYEYRYPERYYYITMDPYTYLNMSGYLLRNDYGVNVFVVTKNPSMQNEPSVLVSALKFIDNSWKTVAQILTDNNGQGYIYLHFNYPHKIKAEKGNLKELIEYYLPTSAMPLEIRLKSSLNQVSNISTLQYIFDYLTVGFKPKQYYLEENQTYLFEFLVSSSKGNLEEYGMNISYANQTIFSQKINDNPSGGIIDVYVNTQNKTGKIKLIAWFKTPELEKPYVIRKSYFIASYPNFGFSVKQMVNQVNQSGLSDTSKKLIALFVSFFVALGVGRVNVLGGGIAFVLALAFFAYFGWFDWLTLGLIGIVSFAIIYLKQYIV